MKTIIATALTALALAAPAAADTASDARAFFALGNDSAAETVINTSAGKNGGVPGAVQTFAAYNDSAAETIVDGQIRRKTVLNGGDTAQDARAKFALYNDSAAERHVK